MGRDKERSINVIDNLTCTIEKGKFVSIVGPSGCGKTTLLRIIAGLEKASSGKVLLDGKSVERPSGDIGLVFQEYALFPWRTTIGNIMMGLEIMGMGKNKRREISMEYIRTFGLEGFENLYPKELSGGMKQRVAIARTLILNPRIVLMDEPFGSLDSQTRNMMQEFLLKIWQDRKDTILFVTHNVDEAVFLSDAIIVLSRRPARILRKFDISLPRPRDRTSRECNIVRKEILKVLKEESLYENNRV